MRPASPALSSSSVSSQSQKHSEHDITRRGEDEQLVLGNLSLIDRARALCAAADDVQRATIEATRRIAAIHGSPDRPPKKKKPIAPTKEPPDICARPPSDVPPPRGEGWRRLGPVSVVCGSNRISAPPQTNRRALTREVEVFVDGGCYSVVPADIDPGGGFCVSLDRDFAGETNMSCMLYIRKKMRKAKRDEPEILRVNRGFRGQKGRIVRAAAGAGAGAATAAQDADDTPHAAAYALSKTEDVPAPPPPPKSMAAALAPFGSVGGTEAATMARPTAPAAPTAQAAEPVPRGVKPLSSPFSVGMERELDMFVLSRPEDGYNRGGDTAVVREAQRRARRRALSERKRTAAARERKMEDLESANQAPTAADIERLKASRRAAVERVACQRQKAEAQKRKAEEKSKEVRRRREAEAAEKADALRSAAAARASAVAAERRQRERELKLARQAEAEARRERVRAVLAYDEARADEREKRVRDETYARIRREERRRELALQRQEEERADKMRLYESGNKYLAGALRTPVSAPPPAVQSARSFFSVAGSASVSETAGGDEGPASAFSAPRRERSSGNRKAWRRGGPGAAYETEDALAERSSSSRSASTDQMEDEPNASISNQQASPPRQIETTSHPGAAHPGIGAAALASTVLASQVSSPVSPSAGLRHVRDSPLQDGSAEVVVSAGLRKSRPPSPTRPPRGGRSAKSDSTSSAGSGGRSGAGSGGKKTVLDRRRITTIPVWKRPAVPLSKPYVPVPRKGGGGL